MSATKKSSTEGTPTTTSWSTAGPSTGSQQQQQPPNRKPHSLSSTSTSAHLLSPSSRYQSFRNASSSSSSLTYSNSLRSNRTAAVSSHHSTTGSPIKKTNSFSNLYSSHFPLSTNSIPLTSIAKISRYGMLSKPNTNHLKAPAVKTARSLTVPKHSLESTPSSSKQESESVINKLSKRLGGVQLSNGSSKTNSGAVSEAGASTSAEPDAHSTSALFGSVSSSLPGCSHSNICDTFKERIQSSPSPNLILRLADTISNSSDDDNFDELCLLEDNKCNIANDSDDSASSKFWVHLCENFQLCFFL